MIQFAISFFASTLGFSGCMIAASGALASAMAWLITEPDAPRAAAGDALDGTNGSGSM